LTVRGRHHDGHVETVGGTGLSVSIKSELEEGLAVNVRFSLPLSSTVVSLPCTVARSDPGRTGGATVGLRFTVVASDVLAEIEAFVEAFGGDGPGGER
jgi:hypothetical protein